MASPQAQARANALNAQLEGNAQTTIDEIERLYIRPVARKAHVCAVSCYDKAGNKGPMDALNACVRTCQGSHQQANNFLQNEINQFQNRVHRAMADCQDEARDLMVPGWEQDAKLTSKVETALLSCMTKAVDSHSKLLKPMKDRVSQQLKNL
ncbi:hypothetical protein MPSEU_000406700 [Mayamaea pseudoterrestris]|nr:hypothetical protein MPSEU_000406700 [Mayamaea pseudoterrestris]